MTTSSNSTPGGLSMEPVRCPKCNGEMLQGSIAKEWGQGGSQCVSYWVEGVPDKSFWHHTSVSAEKCVPIGTFRCSMCGFLESYARPEFAAK